MEEFAELLKARFGKRVKNIIIDRDEITLEIDAEDISALSKILRDDDEFKFEQLIDLCGIDYSTYGQAEWDSDDASASGFSRGVEQIVQPEGVISGQNHQANHDKSVESNPSKIERSFTSRFAVIYHLISYTYNRRLRIRAAVPDASLTIASVTEIWPAANWFEREAFDLYGILFDGHTDLRRILCDYGFVGHPFRKDFPLIGEVEMRYDATQGRCVYEPVSIEARTLVPKVIRKDQPDEPVNEES